MIDETTAPHHAGPANWHHLIAPTKMPMSAGTIQAATLSMDAATDPPRRH